MPPKRRHDSRRDGNPLSKENRMKTSLLLGVLANILAAATLLTAPDFSNELPIILGGLSVEALFFALAFHINQD